MTAAPQTNRNLCDLLKAYERIVIMETLRRNGWNRRKAAAALGVSRRRLTYRMSVLHFDVGAIPHDAPGRRSREIQSPVDQSGVSQLVAGQLSVGQPEISGQVRQAGV